ncbi:hypothetical protein F5Y14DRAFT_409832, partial [Nemania sp. NC0429]
MFDAQCTHSMVRDFEYYLGGLPDPFRTMHRSDLLIATGRPAPKMEADQGQLIDESEWEKYPFTTDYEKLEGRWKKRAAESGYGDHFEAALGKKKRIGTECYDSNGTRLNP